MKIIFPCFIVLFSFFINKADAQKWQPGYFYDTKGNKETGLICLRPSGKPPVSEEAFIEFKEDNRSNPYPLSASDLQSFVIGRNSFVVAVAPRTSDWKNEFDFVKVEVNSDIKLFVFRGNGGGGGGVGIEPDLGVGVGGGGGGFGGGVGGGVGISLGGGGGGAKTAYYYGANTAEMKLLTNANFIDIMTDMMGDEPDVVDKIRSGDYKLSNIEKLVAYFNQVQAGHK